MVGKPAIELNYLVFQPAVYDVSFESALNADSFVFRYTYSLENSHILECRNPRTLIILHGWSTNVAISVPWAMRLSNECWQVIAPDLRGHGASSGEWVTYGARETTDLTEWLLLLARSGGLKGPVSILGFSYGASLALRLNIQGENFERTLAVAPFEDAQSSIKRTIPVLDLPIQPSPERIERILTKAAENSDFDWNDTRVSGTANGATLLIGSQEDVINPAGIVRDLATQIDAQYLELPGLPHEVLLFPVDALSDRVVALLTDEALPVPAAED